MLFRSSTINIEKIAAVLDVATLPQNFIVEFISSLKQELLKDRTFDTIFSDNELYVLFQGLSISIDEIATNSTISTTQIKNINKILEEKLGANFDFNQFVTIYTKNAINNLSQVNFLGLGIDISIKKNRKNLQDIFIRPFFKVFDLDYKPTQIRPSRMHDIEDSEKIVDYKNLLALGERVVILGNPGAGKSLLIKALICDILKRKSHEFKDKGICNYIPFRIELKNYLSFKKEHKGNLLKYLIFILEHEYQISNLTENIVTTILNDKCLLFFDGLDEIFDLSDKIAVRNDIENFHNQFNKIRSVVTSRIIGYEEASLNKTFIEAHILSFNERQIEAYVKQWYSKEEDVDDIRNKEIEGFLSKKHEIDNELITNPLLLSLIVILYRNILKLPESKLEIYQSCTRTLVDKWDASKELRIDLEDVVYKAKDKLFADLAYWQYQQLSGKTEKITYEKAKLTIINSLLKLGIADEYVSDDLAEKFMTYAQKRSIYFENNFTHKTFLEYYTAYWIYSNIEKKHKVDDRNELISSYIGNPFWFIVFELLFNLIDKDQADNDIIDELFTFLIKKNADSLRFLLSIALKLKNISTGIVETTITESLKFIINNAEKSSSYFNRKENSVYYVLQSLLMTDEISYNIIAGQFKKLEKELCDDLISLTKLYILYLEPYIIGDYDYFNLVPLDDILLKKCAERNSYLFTLCYHTSNNTAQKSFETFLTFIDLFGIDELYKDQSSIFDHIGFGKFFQGLPFMLFNNDMANDISYNLAILEERGLGKKQIIDFLAKEEGIYLGAPVIKRAFELLRNNTDNPDITKIIALSILQANDSFRARRGEKFEMASKDYDNIPIVKLINSSISKDQKIEQILEYSL